MNVLITGGTGFIGATVARLLLQRDPDNRLVLFDLAPNKERLGADAGRVVFAQGDTRDAVNLVDTLRQHEISHIIHLAALLRASPFQTVGTNALGTTNILEAARLEKVKRVVFASSAGIFPVRVSDTEKDLMDEDVLPQPNTAYGVCKQFGENLASVYGTVYGLDVITLRLAGVFGPWRISRPSTAPGYWMDGPGLAILGKPMVMPPGNQLVDWIHSEDLAEAVSLSLTVKDPPHRLYNATAGFFRMEEWTGAIRRAFPDAQITVNKDPMLLTTGMRGDRLRDELGFRPRYTPEQAILEYRRVVKEGLSKP